MLGMAVGGEAEEGLERSEASVAGGNAASPVVLEVIEETAHQRGVEVPQVKLGRLLADVHLGVGEEQPEGVAVGVDGVGARIALAAEPADEERLQCGGEGGHRGISLVASARALATANSSGTAVKYQYVDAGST